MSPKVILVTGANRGIGFSVVQALCTKEPTCTVILGVRSLDKGEEAISTLRDAGITASLDKVQLDITDDTSLTNAAEYIQTKYGKLDVLINNAGVARIPSPDAALSDLREIYNTTFATNVTSVMATTHAFMPLLKSSSDPRVINVSSARASLHRSATGVNPATASISYSVSKAALNMYTVEIAKKHPDVLLHVANPGHCKTAFNGFRGVKDPIDGARVVVELVVAERETYGSGFWECEGDGMREVEW